MSTHAVTKVSAQVTVIPGRGARASQEITRVSEQIGVMGPASCERLAAAEDGWDLSTLPLPTLPRLALPETRRAELAARPAFAAPAAGSHASSREAPTVKTAPRDARPAPRRVPRLAFAALGFVLAFGVAALVRAHLAHRAPAAPAAHAVLALG